MTTIFVLLFNYEIRGEYELFSDCLSKYQEL